MKYSKVDDAMQVTEINGHEVLKFVGLNGVLRYYNASLRLEFTTLDGTMVADIGDWVIKEVTGKISVCKPDIFAMTYEKVVD